jgi:predicted TPR repeat methyltransferase
MPMNTDWDDYAENWEADLATHQFADQVFDSLVQQVSIDKKNILDLGCGTGLLSLRMSPKARSIVAVDASEAMIEELDKKMLPNVEPVVDILSRGLAAQHPAFRGQFDIIVASSVCSFIYNLTDTLIVAHAILEEDGVFISWDWLKQTPDDHGLTEAELQTKLADAGFSAFKTQIAFEMPTAKGTAPVVMAIAFK